MITSNQAIEAKLNSLIMSPVSVNSFKPGTKKKKPRYRIEAFLNLLLKFRNR